MASASHGRPGWSPGEWCGSSSRSPYRKACGASAAPRGRSTVFGPYLGRSRLVAKLRGGADRVFGGPGSDLLVGGAGRDFARPGGGFDTCRSIETTPHDDLCETG